MAEINGSILDSVKKSLGLEKEYTVFDDSIVMHINSVFSTLQQIGLGPVNGFEITGSEETWQQFFTPKVLNAVKSYMYLKVRLLFDPPQTSHATTAMEKMAQEAEWRLNVHVESPSDLAQLPTP